MSRLKIITVCYNTPKFIEYQYGLFKRNMDEDFDYVVYDNTWLDEIVQQELVEVCEKFDIKRIEVPRTVFGVRNNDAVNSMHYPVWDTSQRAGKAITWSLQHGITESKRVLLVDCDMFLIRKRSDVSMVKNRDIIGIPWLLIDSYNLPLEYFTNQLFYVNTDRIADKKMLDFSPCTINEINLDCGGKLHYLFKMQPDLTTASFNNTLLSRESLTFSYNDELKDFVERDLDILRKVREQKTYLIEVFDYCFLHFKSGTNWNELAIYEERLRNLYYFLDYKLYDKVQVFPEVKEESSVTESGEGSGYQEQNIQI